MHSASTLDAISSSALPGILCATLTSTDNNYDTY